MKLSTRSIPDEDSHPERADDEKLSKNPYGSSINLKNKFTIKDEKTIFQTSKQEQTMLYQDEFASHQYMREASRLSVIREHEIFDSEMPVKANSGGLKASRLVRHHHQNSDPLPSGEKEIGVDAAVQLSKFAMTAGDWLSVSNKDCNKNKEKVLAASIIGHFKQIFFDRLSPLVKEAWQKAGEFPSEKIQDDTRMLEAVLFRASSEEGCSYEGLSIKDENLDFGASLDLNGNYYEGHKKKGIDPYLKNKGVFSYKKHGYGRYFENNGDFYCGDFSYDKYNGHGRLQSKNGAVYEGEFCSGCRHGFGREKETGGGVYEGQWENGSRRGKGVLAYSNGDLYEGEFVLGLKCGKGKFTFADGSKYEGEFVENRYHGKGVMVLANGNKYMGDYSNGKPDGFGEFISRDGKSYKGPCSGGKPHGEGVVTDKHGNQFIERFIYGVRVESTSI